MRRMIWGVLLLAAALLAVPAHAAEAELVMRGTRSGYVDVTFPAPVDLESRSTAWNRLGAWGGFWLEPLDALPPGSTAQPYVGVLAIRYKSQVVKFSVGGRAGVTSNGHYVVTLAEPPPAGRYRVHMFAPGPFEFRSYLPGHAKSIVVTPKVTTRPQFVSTAPAAVPAQQTHEFRAAFNVTRHAVFGGDMSVGSPGYYGVQCFAPAGQACDVSTGTDIDVTGGSGSTISRDHVFAVPGELAPGRWESVETVVADRGVESFVRFALAIETPSH